MLTDRSRPHCPTAARERRLVLAAGRGDAGAQAELLHAYEPMVRHLAHRFYLPGGEPQDLAQQARIGVIDAARTWDPSSGVPFSSFAWLCATRDVQMLIATARAHKHEILTRAARLGHLARHTDGVTLELAPSALPGTPLAVGRRDEDPLARAIAREQLRHIVARVRTLSDLERDALGLAASDYSYRQIAERLHVGVRAVNNALQRARGKLGEPTLA